MSASFALVLGFFLPSIILSQAYNFNTDPTYSSSTQQDVIIRADNGDKVNISCIVKDNSSTQIQTNWSVTINETTTAVDFLSSGGGPSGYSYLSVAGTYESNLTVDFSTNINPIKVACVAGSNNVTFHIGIDSAPDLDNSTNNTIINATEGNTHTVSLAGTAKPFPPVTWAWKFNQGAINDISISVTEDQIIFNPVNRTHSGVYKLTVSNDAGTATSNFILNVQYLPGGNRGPTTIYAYPGSTVTLLAFTNFSSNPDPFISRWLNNSGLPIDPSTDARMTEVSTTTKSLTISSVTTNDHGQWSFGAVNTIGSGSIAIDLYIARPAGAVSNLMNTTFKDTEVSLAWTAPTSPGVPVFSNYKIRLPTSNYTTTSTSITITGLLPNTNYDIIVAAVSTYYPDGNETASISITTNVGFPKIESANASSVDGSIQINWDLRHTGGVSKDTVNININCNNQEATTGSGSGSGSGAMLSGSGSGSGATVLTGLTSDCVGNVSTCLDSSLKGSNSVGPVHAGRNYYCTLMVNTQYGSDSVRITFWPTLGLPSTPVIVTHEVAPGQIQLSLCSVYAGVLSSDTSFYFRATINNTASTSLQTKTLNVASYVSNSTQSWIIQLPGGTYTISVVAGNRYGASGSSNAITATISSLPIATSTISATSTMVVIGPTSDGASGAATGNIPIIVGSIVGSVAALVAVGGVVGFIAFYVYNKKKGGLLLKRNL